MRRLTKTISGELLAIEELGADMRAVLRAAANARTRAQAPYSNYHVGAAVVAASGRTFVGCNVERCSYTQTTHAEQNAIDAMVANDGPTKLDLVAIAAAPADVLVSAEGRCEVPRSDWPSSLEQLAPPCGHCLQCIWENCCGDRSVRLLNLQPGGLVMAMTIGDALPMAFGPDALGISILR